MFRNIGHMRPKSEFASNQSYGCALASVPTQSRHRNTSRREIRASSPFTRNARNHSTNTAPSIVSTKPPTWHCIIQSTKSGKELKVPSDNIAADNVGLLIINCSSLSTPLVETEHYFFAAAANTSMVGTSHCFGGCFGRIESIHTHQF